MRSGLTLPALLSGRAERVASFRPPRRPGMSEAGAKSRLQRHEVGLRRLGRAANRHFLLRTGLARRPLAGGGDLEVRLLQQAYSGTGARQQPAIAAWMDQGRLFPGQAGRESDGVEQKACVQGGGALGGQRRYEACLGGTCYRRLANHDERAPHVHRRSVTLPRGRNVTKINHAMGTALAKFSSKMAGLSLAERLEQQLAEAGLQVVVEESDGALILSGVVDSEESRQAAADIVSDVAPNARIDNQLEIESVFPTDVGEFVSDEAKWTRAEEELPWVARALRP